MQNDHKHDRKLAELIRITDELEARKALYDELDKLTIELKESGFQHAIFHGHEIKLCDNFEEKNVQFRVAGVRRFECKIKKMK